MFGKRVSLTEVGYKDVERLVKEKYPSLSEYSYAAVQVCGNDERHAYSLTGKLDKYEQEKWQAVVAEQGLCEYANDVILNKLCADGHIPAGEYEVVVSW